MLKIVGYGIGNIQAFLNIYKRLNVPCEVATTAAELATAERIILPGVGSFDWAMQKLQDSGMRETLDAKVLVEKKPVLGICVGMQMLARSSEEGQLPGLGWVDATVKRFDDARFTQKTRLPHMGWNDVVPAETRLFTHIPSPRFYFLHSYYFAPNDAAATAGVTDYQGRFTSAVAQGNIFGVQFHPEKSHQWGVQLLKNFSEID